MHNAHSAGCAKLRVFRLIGDERVTLVNNSLPVGDFAIGLSELALYFQL